ncbi:unnamed protein product [Schistosoma margrebowiei]|uniref:Uncharacterized protein n=1 Tax=Schistosoma margrebowiei TaxID=48269 RepID=A0A183MC93_9TREM|nr:unnamed protein product [Schistosoma margrebowiei]
MGITFSSTEFSGIDLLTGGSFVDLEYANDKVVFDEDADKVQSLLVAPSNNVRMFGMRFSLSKYELLLQDWSASTSELRIGSEVVERVDNFTCLGSLTSPNRLVSDEISARIQKCRLVFANLRHLWQTRDIHLSIKGRVNCAAVCSILLHGCETWPLRMKNTLNYSTIFTQYYYTWEKKQKEKEKKKISQSTLANLSYKLCKRLISFE